MLFNSIEFAIFLVIVFSAFWLLQKYPLKYQNFLIVVVSYIFYGWWDWRFLYLIFFTSVADFTISNLMYRQDNKVKRKLLFALSLFQALGLLTFFKYYNFFVDSFIHAFSFVGLQLHARTLNVILPVGISFYTFQTMSYTIDVYRGSIKPTKNLIAFLAYVSFFPQLVAGPIERASHLLPQFLVKRKFSYDKAVDGLRHMLWGLFKKVIIADNCAKYADMIFNDHTAYSGSTLALGAVFFAFQIYGDFSGYSDIAIGVARLFGFDIMRNFAFPYFSRDIAEFWRRWHISLSTWFRDYVYIPLGGSKGGLYKRIRNTMIIFVVSGLWHGANWTFVVWGALNALYFLPLLLGNRNRRNIDIVGANGEGVAIREVFSILVTFALTTLAWIFFRAENIGHAFSYISSMFSLSFFSIPEVLPRKVLFFLAIFLVIEWKGRESMYAIEHLGFKWPRPVRLAFYYLLIIVIFFYKGEQQEFIYFQF